jgi:hypothetical protein
MEQVRACLLFFLVRHELQPAVYSSVPCQRCRISAVSSHSVLKRIGVFPF